MARYIIKRVLWMIPVMLLVIVVVFSIYLYRPGDPVSHATLGSRKLIRPRRMRRRRRKWDSIKTYFFKGYFVQLGTLHMESGDKA